MGIGAAAGAAATALGVTSAATVAAISTGATALAVGVGGLLATKALMGGSKGTTVNIPATPTPAVMPVMNQQAVNAATQQQAAAAAAQSGRMSTVLSQATGSSDKLG